MNKCLHFSEPEPKAQEHYCDHTLSVFCLPLTFHIFDFSETAEQNSTKLEQKQVLKVLYQVYLLFFFCANSENTIATLASDWMRHSQLLLKNDQMEYDKTWQEACTQ